MTWLWIIIGVVLIGAVVLVDRGMARLQREH